MEIWKGGRKGGDHVCIHKHYNTKNENNNGSSSDTSNNSSDFLKK